MLLSFPHFTVGAPNGTGPFSSFACLMIAADVIFL